MAEPTFTLPEVMAMLSADGASPATKDRLHKRASFVIEKRGLCTRDDDHFEVGSGYSHVKHRGHVRFKTGQVEHQMTPEKAKQIGHWLIEAAEAAIADTTVMTWIRDKIGVEDPGNILLQLREIRQGTRGVKFEP